MIFLTVALQESPYLDMWVELYPEIKAYVSSHSVDDASVDDVIQEAAFVVCRKFEKTSIETYSQFRSWVYNITYKEIKRHFRKNLREQPTRNDFFVYLHDDGVEANLAEIMKTEDIDMLNEVISGLKDDEKQFIHLKYLDELSYSEMTEELGKSENALMSKNSRLIQKIKNILIFEKKRKV